MNVSREIPLKIVTVFLQLSWLLLVCCIQPVTLNAQRPGLLQQANTVHANIYQSFYDSTKGLFKEHIELKKGDKELLLKVQ